MFFDAHVHLGRSDSYAPPQGSLCQLPIYQNATENRWPAFVRQAEKICIGKALVFPFPFPTVDVARANEYVLEAADRRPDLFLPLLLISEDTTQLDSNLTRIAGAKESFYLPGGREVHRFDAAYDFLQQHDLLLLIHPHQLDRISRIRRIARDFPKLRIILAHAGRKWLFTGDEVIETVVPALRNLNTVYFDTSTVRNSTVIRKLVQSVGSGRVLFGSDYPFYKCNGEDVYRQEMNAILSAGLSDEDSECILWHNSRDLLLSHVWIRRAIKDDLTSLNDLLAKMTALERKHLAMQKKLEIFRKNIRSGRHVLLLEDRSGILAFMRESGRPKNKALIEEFYVRPSSRGYGHGLKLLQLVQRMFDGLEAKTFADNHGMNRLLERAGFTLATGAPGNSILVWEWSNAT